MTDNQVLAICAAIIAAGDRNATVQSAARASVAIGELFGVHASEDTKMELLLGGGAFEQPVTDKEADDCIGASL